MLSPGALCIALFLRIRCFGFFFSFLIAVVALSASQRFRPPSSHFKKKGVMWCLYDHIGIWDGFQKLKELRWR